MNKKSKKIKRLNKQLKKLNKRINKMDKQIEGLQDAPERTIAEPMAEELPAEPELEIAAQPASSFSAEEVEVASEITDEAEAVLDILERGAKKEGKKRLPRDLSQARK